MTQSMDRCERILVKYPLFKTAIARIQACFDSHDATAEPDCCPLVGESGSGKTTIISYFASLHPRVDHKSGVEVPVLVAKVPGAAHSQELCGNAAVSTWRSAVVSRQHSGQKHSAEGIDQALPRAPTCTRRIPAFRGCPPGNIVTDVADWLKEQVEEARLAIVVSGLQRSLEVLRQNEQLRRRFGSTLRVGAFRWDIKEDRTTYRAFLRAVQDQLPEYEMPNLADLDLAFRMHYASYGLIGYTMKIIRGAARIASSHPRRQITIRTFSQSYADQVWSERLSDPNPFGEKFDCEKAPPIALPSATACIPPSTLTPRAVRLELHA